MNWQRRSSGIKGVLVIVVIAKCFLLKFLSDNVIE